MSCRRLLEKHKEDKSKGSFEKDRPTTIAGHMQAVHGLLAQMSETLASRSTGAGATARGQAAHSPVKAVAEIGGSQSYASEVASQKRSLRALQEQLACAQPQSTVS